jgi:hypothetical protein
MGLQTKPDDQRHRLRWALRMLQGRKMDFFMAAPFFQIRNSPKFNKSSGDSNNLHANYNAWLENSLLHTDIDDMRSGYFLSNFSETCKCI